MTVADTALPPRSTLLQQALLHSHHRGLLHGQPRSLFHDVGEEGEWAPGHARLEGVGDLRPNYDKFEPAGPTERPIRS